MDFYHYQGIRPHAREAAARHGADAALVEQNRSIVRLNVLLGQVASYRNKGDFGAAADMLKAAESSIAALEASLDAGRAAFAEVSAACQPEPSPDETMADPDRVPTEDQPTFNVPPEDEAGQEALTEDSQYGNPEDAIGRTDLAPEDDPPLGRKSRRR